MKFKMILISLIAITMLISACSNDATEIESEYADLPNTVNEAQTILELTTDKKAYPTQVKELVLKIKNTGKIPVRFGTPYDLEKLINGEWYHHMPNKERAFTALGIEVEPNSEYEQTVPIDQWDDQLTEGTYRVIKSFTTDDGDFVLAAEFEIKE